MRIKSLPLLAALCLLGTQLFAADKEIERSLLIGVEQISMDSAVYGDLDNLSIYQIAFNSDRFHFNDKVNSHLDLVVGGGDVFYPSVDFGLRYVFSEKLAVGPLVGYGAHEILKDGEKVPSSKREAIAVQGMHYGIDARYLLNDTFVMTGGYKKMSYGDKDFDYAERMENTSLYLRVGFYW